MSSQTIRDLIGAFSITEFGVQPNAGNDAGAAINRAFAQIQSDEQYANGTLFLPPGTYTIRTPVWQPSGTAVRGAGNATILQLGADANVDIWNSLGSRIRLADLRIDGNRSNNANSGRGLVLTDVSDAWLDNVEVVSCVEDGVFLNQCARVQANGLSSMDNGRHGVSLNATEFSVLMGVRSVSNCQVATVGTGDGINLDTLSHDNLIVMIGYEESLAGDRQGYAVREALAGGCYRNLVHAVAQGNRTAAFLLGSDSMALTANSWMVGSMGIGTASPDAAALVDFSSDRQGIAIPGLTTAQRLDIASPPARLVVYDTTLNKLCVYTGSAWETVTSA